MTVNTSVKKSRKIKRKYQVAPEFTVSSENQLRKKITIGDLRDLVLWILAEQGPPSPNWVLVKNKMAISKVVCIQLGGLRLEDFQLNSKDILAVSADSLQVRDELSAFKKIFDWMFPTEAPGTKDQLHSAMTSFIEVPMTKAERMVQNRELDSLKNNTDKLSYEDLLLTPCQLQEYKFPLHPETQSALNELQPLEKGWVDFVSLEEDVTKSAPRVFAIDCEMCETQVGKELTRITVIKYDGTVVFDSLVKPDRPVVNYLTRYSGITEDMLKDVETRITDIQTYLTSLISITDFLVGHSLESDLNALKMRHSRIIDTSVLFQQRRLFKPSLKMLASKFLSREIQTGSDGHDSKEDALACLDLLKLKIQKGPSFGRFISPHINIAKKLAEMDPPQTTAIIDYGVPHWHEEFAKTVISCTDDDEIISNIIKQSRTHNFVCSHLRELEHLIKGSDKNDKDNETNGNEKDLDRDKFLYDAYNRINSRLEKLFQNLEEHTALIVWTGTGDSREVFKLQKKRKQYRQEYNTKKWDEITVEWTSEDNFNLLQAVEVAKSGMAFISLKGEKLNIEDDSQYKRVRT